MNVISSVYNLLKRRTYRPLVLLWDMSKTWISLPWIFFYWPWLDKFSLEEPLTYDCPQMQH